MNVRQAADVNIILPAWVEVPWKSLKTTQAGVSIMCDGLGIKPVESLQFEVVHRQAQIGELGLGGVIGHARFQPLRGAMESLAQCPVFVGIAQFAEQSPDLFRSSPGLSDQPQCGGKSDPARLRLLEHATLENATLRWPIRVDATRAILAESRARLGKAGDGFLPPRKRDRQPEQLKFLGIVARFEFDEVEECPVAA
jgi:hypothetical protein